MLRKKGTPEKIKMTIIGEDQFNKLRENIAVPNNLVRCSQCGKLLSKTSDDGATLQHRKLSAIVQGKANIYVKCTECGCVAGFQVE